jgi:hypothetical protein
MKLTIPKFGVQVRVLSLLFFAGLLSACGGGGGSDAGSTGGGTTTTRTVDDVVLTPSQLSLPLSTFDAGNYDIDSVLVGNSIYFGNFSNTAKPQFFVRYSIPNNTFSAALSVTSDLCGCGYTSKLVNDGTNIFYIANNATKYTASTNTWSGLFYPSTASDNNGEAGVTYYNGNIYFLGGRTPSNLFKYYNIATDSWFTVPNYLYATSWSELVAFKDRIYAIGGYAASNQRLNKMAYFSTKDSTWTAVQDPPFNVFVSAEKEYAAVLGDYIFLLQNGSIYVYDPATDEWGSMPTRINGLPDSATLMSDGQNLYIAGKNASNIPAVFKVAVSFK